MNNDVLISNIQRFSLDDGEGIRTTVFFKGCNLKCKWCHNPECIDFGPAVQLIKTSCTSCGICEKVCKQKVHRITNGQHTMEREACIHCGECMEFCNNDALKRVGKNYSAEEVMDIILKDKAYYETSGGGVTFSGGEPMLALSMLKELLMKCKKQGLSTAVDTAGHVSFDKYQKVMPYTDVFLIDLKVWDDEKHRFYTGVSNALIKENIRRISDSGKRIIIRIPVIGSVNDDLKELGEMAEFLKSIKMVELVQLLPYHLYGIGKYEMIGMESEQERFYAPGSEFMNQACALFQKKGITVSF